MRLILTLVVSAWLAIPLQTSSYAQPAPAPPSEARFGFVIGNDEYAGAPLPTAANDAALVADALKSAGFDVTGARNLDADTFRAAYREFIEKVEAAGPGAVAAIYLSGHGMQSDGENYLVPPGARIARDTDLALAGIRLSDLTRPLAGLQNRAKVFLFDLSHASPLAKESATPPGLMLIDPDRGSLVGYNAGPGEIAPVAKPPYGPYAQALAEMLRQPGLDMNEIMVRVRARTAELTGGAQVPWHVSKIDPPLILLERGADAPPLQVAPQAVIERRQRPMRELTADEAYAAALELDTTRAYEDFLVAFPSSPYARNVRGMLAARREAATWRRSLIVNSPDSYWSYLRRYPRGPHSSEARRRLARLSAPIEAPPSFAEITYDIGPPPPDEMVYFEGSGGPVYFDAAVPPPPPAVFMAPAPVWWRPPPPPVFADGSDYFLPEPEIVPAPVWVRPPLYVAAPTPPIVYEDDRPRGASIMPYVAIPAALAAGIVAGRLINRPGRPPVVGMPPNGPPNMPGGPRPPGAPGGGQVGGPTTAPQGAHPFLPPVAAPPSAVKPGALQAIGLQPGTGAPLRPQPTVVKGNAQQLLNPTAPGGPGQPAGQPGRPLGQPGSPVTTAPVTAPLPGAPPQSARPPLPGAQPGAPAATGPVPGAQPQQGRQPLPGLQPGAPTATAPVPGARPLPGSRPPGAPGQAPNQVPGQAARPPGQPAATAPVPGTPPQLGRQPLPDQQPGAPAATAPVPGAQPQGRPPGVQPGQPPAQAARPPGVPSPTAPAPGAQPGRQPLPSAPPTQAGRPPNAPVTPAPAPLGAPPAARPAPGPNPAAMQQQMQQQQRQQDQAKQQQQMLEQQRLQRQNADKQRQQQLQDQQRQQQMQQQRQQQQMQQQQRQQQMQQQQQQQQMQRQQQMQQQQQQQRQQQQQMMQQRQQQQQPRGGQQPERPRREP